MRPTSSGVDIGVPETLVVGPVTVTVWSPSSAVPTTYATTATTSTVTTTNAMTATSLATSSRVRPTGRMRR